MPESAAARPERVRALRDPAAWGRALALSLGAAVLAWPLASAAGVIAAALAAFAGALAGDTLDAPRPGGARLHLRGVALLAALGLALGVGAARALVALSAPAAWLGPVAALSVGEALLWLSLAGPSVLLLRLAARRSASAAVLEVALVATAFAFSFAAHRGGMLNRPLALGDLAWTRGIDPALVFLGLGALCTLLLAALLVAEERRQRLWLHASALGAIALLLLLVVRVAGLPAPRQASDLGLTGKPEEERAQAGGPGGESGEGSQASRADELADLPFRDEYPRAGGEAPVAVVVLHDDYEPPSGVYYFRQTAFSQYNGRRLVQSLRADSDLDVLKHFPGSSIEVPDAPPVSDLRKALPTSVGLLVDHVRPFALDSPVRFEPAASRDALRFQRAYQVLSNVQTLPYEGLLGRRAGDPRWSREQWDHYTEASADPRYAALAEEQMGWLLERHKSDPLARALAVKAYLDEQGIYSRKSRHAGDEDPTASFLFGDLTGYCVHFAHAAVYLLRSLGLPARVAAGYAVPAGDRAGGSALMIRGVNAHAWPELYLEGVGWVVVDPAPRQTLEEAAPNPDSSLQRMLGEMLREQLGGGEPAEDAPGPRLAFVDVARALALALAAAAALGFGVKLYRRWLPRVARARQLPRVGYRASLDRLCDVGLRRRFGESRERFAARVGATAPAFAALTALHLRAALGPQARPDAAALRRLEARVRGELRSRVPFYRRALGAANPVSWLAAR
jgi:transglutaminase-like putative cysteine protease